MGKNKPRSYDLAVQTVSPASSPNDLLVFSKGHHDKNDFVLEAYDILKRLGYGDSVRVQHEVWRLVKGLQYPAELGKQGAFPVTVVRRADQ